MLNIIKKTKVINIDQSGDVPEDIFLSSQPVILRGLVKNWSLLKVGLQSNEQAIDYLKRYYNGKPSFAYFGSPEIKGRFFYNEDATKLNYESKQTKVDEVLDLILATISEENPPAHYIASNFIDSHFPKLREENDLTLSSHIKNNLITKPDIKIWIGNSTLACCHYDTSSNIACCVVGKRRFTLFPPDQINNLYPGPLELTPGGPTISMVDFHQPDFDKYPRFRDALAVGQVAELEAGDAIFIPCMWWHQVEGMSPFNVLVNYWWNNTPKYMGEGTNVLQHALLSIKDRSIEEKKAWKHIFDYYIFGDAEHAGEHLPEQARGALGKIDDIQARKLRAKLINQLNR